MVFNDSFALLYLTTIPSSASQMCCEVPNAQHCWSLPNARSRNTGTIPSSCRVINGRIVEFWILLSVWPVTRAIVSVHEPAQFAPPLDEDSKQHTFIIGEKRLNSAFAHNTRSGYYQYPLVYFVLRLNLKRNMHMWQTYVCMQLRSNLAENWRTLHINENRGID